MLYLLTRSTIQILDSVTKTYSIPLTNILYRSYAAERKPSTASFAASTKKREFEVETDPYKLVTYVCGSNFYKTGEDIKIKPESEYPDWLWSIHLGTAKELKDYDPNSKAYWLKARTLARRKKNRMHKLKCKIMSYQWPTKEQ